MPRLTLIILTICFFFSLPEYLLAKNLGSWLEKAQALEKDGFWDEAAEAWEKLTTTNTNSKLAVYHLLTLYHVHNTQELYLSHRCHHYHLRVPALIMIPMLSISTLQDAGTSND